MLPKMSSFKIFPAILMLKISPNPWSKINSADVLESIQLKSGGSPPTGAKGVEAVTAGSIAISVLPALFPKVLDFLQAWSLQGKGRTIKFKGKVAGQNIDFEGSLAEMEKLVAMLEKEQKRKKK